MARHILTSHGADFFGEDRHPFPLVTNLADHVANSVPYVQREQIAGLLEPLHALKDAAATGAQFNPAEAGAFAEVLLRVSRLGFVKPKLAAVARSLADAAARAAADGEMWTWTLTDESEAAA
ncbi:DUF7739 domain-containing protein [Streptomyces tanashiensis]|uniref:DUF7739 domain-containing protein n=1 Tax=Streptomyces tanashiensis TaxID=67367 RepID=UPI003405BE5D